MANNKLRKVVQPNNTVIVVDGVSKRFMPTVGQGSIKEIFTSIFSGKKRTKKAGHLVLNDVSFNIKKGDFFGIVGRNGSGKSTLLKMIAGVYSPTKGAISVNGRLVPFIELGVGFNPELSGRDNVFLNGALLGFNRTEMHEMYDEIVSFAELEEHMDVKLKNFSSGMQVRLAFSIAIRAKAEILLIDEVLAVGDAAFQKKCTEVFSNYKATKQTIVLVTHDMSAVQRFCNRAAYIEDGELKVVGSPKEVADLYTKSNEDAYMESQIRNEEYTREQKEQEAKLIENLGVKIELVDSQTKKKKRIFEYSNLCTLDISWDSDLIKNVGVALVKQTGEYVFGTNTFVDTKNIKGKRIAYSVKLDIGPGEYRFVVGTFGEKETDIIKFVEDTPVFSIRQAGTLGWQGITKLDHNWK